MGQRIATESLDGFENFCFLLLSGLMEKDQASAVKWAKSHFHLSMLCIVP